MVRSGPEGVIAAAPSPPTTVLRPAQSRKMPLRYSRCLAMHETVSPCDVSSAFACTVSGFMAARCVSGSEGAS